MRRLPSVHATRLLRRPTSVIAAKALLIPAVPTIVGTVTCRVRDSLVLRSVRARTSNRSLPDAHGGR